MKWTFNLVVFQQTTKRDKGTDSKNIYDNIMFIKTSCSAVISAMLLVQ
jgi:hypothetical protein